jgi:hypothetical protein
MREHDHGSHRKLRRLRSALAKGERDPAAVDGLSGERDFDDLAGRFRALTAERTHTPAEELLREGRDER